ncbi:MAG TPA: DEAD/DEAH box helicase [Candidatus Eisenbergiella intestinipullorum]|nr:DEAD/DEAH box helicase [Candidatus Eisenbergiella intestinipullorum]
MINRTDVRRECHHVTFSRGEELQQKGAVRRLNWEKKEEDGFDVVQMDATVCGSGEKLYEVKIKVDEDYREILEYECECPAFFSYSGMCKHCVAVLLTYLEERNDAKKMGGRIPAAGGTGGQTPAVRTDGRSTSFGFDLLLERYVQKDRVNLMQKQILGSVRLEPSFSFYGESLKVTFRIGNRRLYVVKNLGDFVNAMAGSERVSYGKELAFYHHPDAFAPEYRPLVNFLTFTLLRGSSYMGNYLSSIYKKELVVSAELADGFMESVRGIPLREEGTDREWTLEDGEPERLLEIASEGSGAVVRLKKVPMLTGRKGIYFFAKKKIFCVSRERTEEIREFLLYMDHYGKSGLYIAPSELPAFVRDMLPVLSGHFQIKMENFDPERWLPPQAGFALYLDAPQRDLITCSLFSVYGEERYNLFEDTALSGQRDTWRETEFSGQVASFFTAFDPQRHQMVLSGEEELYDFLQEGLFRLQELAAAFGAEIYISDALKGIRVLPSPHVSVGISLSGGLLELELSCEEMPLAELAQILSRYDRKRKYFRLKDGSFVDLSDAGVRSLSDLGYSLCLKEKELAEGSLQLPGYRALYLNDSLEESSFVNLNRGKSFRALVRNMKTVADSDYELPEELNGILRGYQKTGFCWIKTLQANGFGGILADDMGLGKTLQTIAFLLSDWKEAHRRYLVVCPASLVYNWKSELERFAPCLPVILAAGSQAEREATLRRLEGEDGVLVTSYDLLRRDVDRYEKMTFAVQIIDEAQFIKNHATQAARAVKAVQADFRLALTGTPVENRLSELWSIFDYLMPGYLFSYSRFREEFESPIVNRKDDGVMQRLQKMIRPFVLRRLKQDVLSDLPDKIEKNMYAAMEGEQRQLYDAHVQRLVMLLSGQSEKEFQMARIQILAELTKLRQLCCDPGLLLEGYQGESAKTQLCLELIRNAAESGHKVLLFSQFTAMLDRLKAALKREGIRFYSLDGSTPKARRMQLVDAFNRDETQVFCISLKAGGTGLNLTGADIVIHFDPWWNVAVQNQATDRAHRIGQKNVVTVYRLIARDTIEEKIVQLQEKKSRLAEQILGGEEMGPVALSKEALMEILEGRQEL